MNDSQPSLQPIWSGRQVAAAGAWYVFMRYGMRVLGLINVLILARILSPADYGLVAQATIIVGVFNILQEIGVEEALLRDPRADRADFDTGWTIRLMQSALATVLIAAAAPIAAAFFREPRLELVIWVVAVVPVMEGLRSIGLVQAEKDYRVRRIVVLELLARGVALAGSVGVALVWRTYWALVVGIVLQRAAGTILSYVVAPRMPHLTLARWRKLLSVSIWFFARRLIDAAWQIVDRAVIGRLIGSSGLGLYTVGRSLSDVFIADLTLPAARAALPAMAQIQDDRSARARYVAAMTAMLATIGAPAGVGLATVAAPAVIVLVGQQWIEAAPILAVFAAGAVLGAIYLPTEMMLVAMKKLVFPVLSRATTIVVFVALVLAWGAGLDTFIVALLVIGATGAAMLANMIYADQRLGIRLGATVGAAARPLAAAAAMHLALRAVEPWLSDPAVVPLAIWIAIGVVAYGCALMLLWFLAGRPAGTESHFLTLVGLSRWTADR